MSKSLDQWLNTQDMQHYLTAQNRYFDFNFYDFMDFLEAHKNNGYFTTFREQATRLLGMDENSCVKDVIETAMNCISGLCEDLPFIYINTDDVPDICPNLVGFFEKTFTEDEVTEMLEGPEHPEDYATSPEECEYYEENGPDKEYLRIGYYFLYGLLIEAPIVPTENKLIKSRTMKGDQ